MSAGVNELLSQSVSRWVSELQFRQLVIESLSDSESQSVCQCMSMYEYNWLVSRFFS